jgi:redox-sensing transcriptional repressor
MGTTAAQVRKDLSHFGSFGKRGLGYATEPLRQRLEEILGVDRSWPVILVGAGRIGSALFEHAPFRDRGFNIVAVLDRDAAKVGKRWGQVEIQDVKTLPQVVARHDARVAILAIPRSDAQAVAEAMEAAGIRGILNFAPVPLRLGPAVQVNEVNLALEMEALSFALRNQKTGSDAGTSGEERGSRP